MKVNMAHNILKDEFGSLIKTNADKIEKKVFAVEAMFLERLTSSVSNLVSERTKSRESDLKMQMSYLKGWTSDFL